MVDYYLYKQKPNFVKGIEEIQGTKTIDLLFDFFGKCESEILRIDIL